LPSSIFKQAFYLKADNEQETTQSGLLSFVNICRSGIQILKRNEAFKAVEFLSCQFPHSSDDETWSNNVSELTLSNNFQSFVANTETAFSISDSKVMLVPTSLFSETGKKNSFEFLFDNSEDLHVKAQKLSNSDTVGIFGIPKNIAKIVSKPIHSSCLTWLDRLQTNSEKAQIQLVLEEKQFALVVFKDASLVFSNWFQFGKPEDVLYYLMASLESLKILHSEVEVSLNGNIEKGDAMHTTIAKYISKLSFGKRPKNLTYSYSFKELQEHRFPFIFEAACA